MEESEKKICAIVGPTATGKSIFAVWLAKKIDAEIISADSMQIYKDMDVATAKITEKQKCGVPHHMMSFLDVKENFSVSDYVKMAKDIALNILKSGKKVILVGGTGLYIDSFLNGINFQDEAKCENLRRNLELEIKKNGITYMYEKLKKIDPIYAKRVDANNGRRILRAIETFILTGKNFTENINLNNSLKVPFTSLKIGLNFKDRVKLYENINIRVKEMLKKGLLKEARKMFSKMCSKTATQAIGYKEFFPYFSGKIGLSQAILNLKQNTRRYAKRQITWFKRDKNINWFFLDEEDYDKICLDILNLVERFFG